MNNKVLELKEKILSKIYEFSHELSFEKISIEESRERTISNPYIYSSYDSRTSAERKTARYRDTIIDGIKIEMEVVDKIKPSNNTTYVRHPRCYYTALNVRLTSEFATIECEYSDSIGDLVESLVKYHYKKSIKKNNRAVGDKVKVQFKNSPIFKNNIIEGEIKAIYNDGTYQIGSFNTTSYNWSYIFTEEDIVE